MSFPIPRPRSTHTAAMPHRRSPLVAAKPMTQPPGYGRGESRPLAADPLIKATDKALRSCGIDRSINYYKTGTRRVAT